jgi:GNAT superfamily N-acetyltransferase
MRIHPDYQYLGLGSMILESLEKKAIEIGYRELVLRTSYILVAARHFYAKHGYQQIEVSDDSTIITIKNRYKWPLDGI